MDILIAPAPKAGRRAHIEREMRDAIRQGRLPVGAALPSTRALAAQLGVSRGTVVEAYAQLVAEGYVDGRPGAAMTVAGGMAQARPVESPQERRTGPRFDLRPGTPDPGAFPASEWLGALRRVLRDLPADASGYGDPRGRGELRQALAGYLGRARGVAAEPDDIVVCSGFTHGLELTVRALAAKGVRRIAMEDPCLPPHRAIVEDAIGRGGEVIPIPISPHGIDVDAVIAARARAVLLTPAHQYPLGVTLAAAARARLVAWARDTGATILEDDYDGELRYDRLPVGALQGLAPECVVYLGTVSKSIAPAIRVGWVVAPAGIAALIARRKLFRETVPAIDQLALADLITGGRLDRHLRRRRLEYRKRRDLLVATLRESVPELRVTGIAAGLHALVELPPGGPTEEEAMAVLRARSVAVIPLRALWHKPGGAVRRTGLIVGYGRPRGHEYPAAFRALGEGLREVMAGAPPGPPAST